MNFAVLKEIADQTGLKKGANCEPVYSWGQVVKNFWYGRGFDGIQ